MFLDKLKESYITITAKDFTAPSILNLLRNGLAVRILMGMPISMSWMLRI